jgi:hypothetical protein
MVKCSTRVCPGVTRKYQIYQKSLDKGKTQAYLAVASVTTFYKIVTKTNIQKFGSGNLAVDDDDDTTSEVPEATFEPKTAVLFIDVIKNLFSLSLSSRQNKLHHFSLVENFSLA